MNFEKMRNECESVSEVMKAIGHPQRLILLCYLSEGEKTVSELQKLSGSSQSQVSQFLRRMLREKLVEVRKDGQFSRYSVKNPKVIELMGSLQNIFCEVES